MADLDLIVTHICPEEPEFTVANVVAEGTAHTVTGDLVTSNSTASATSVVSYEHAWHDAFSIAKKEANIIAKTLANTIDETLAIVKRHAPKFPDLSLYPTLPGNNKFTGSNTFNALYQTTGNVTANNTQSYICDYASGGAIFYIPTTVTGNFLINVSNFPTTYTTAPYCICVIIPNGQYFCTSIALNGTPLTMYLNGGIVGVQTIVTAAAVPNSIIQQFIIYATAAGTTAKPVIASVNVVF